ncbi:MAG: glycoside hydrolase family 172 protein [Pseudomonadota bacterium]
MRFMLAIMIAVLGISAAAQAQEFSARPDLTRPQDYSFRHTSSADPSGANVDSLKVAPGETVTLFDQDGPGSIAHIWFTFGDRETYHLKRIVMRIYWDGEATPSVETPVGDFFGLGLGDYVNWQSEVLSVGSVRSMNSFFAMPFARHARITMTNEGREPMGDLYYNIDWRHYAHALPKDTYYFHAQYRQSQPTHGWTNDWLKDGDPLVNTKPNLDGADNYVFADIKGRGHFVGITMSVLQNQDEWWGEGDDMFFVDGEKMPSLKGTGAEDYVLGAHDFGGVPFSYGLYGAPVVGEERAGGRSSVYRFHLETPIPFNTAFKATIEHGHANHRSDNYSSVAYWYQAEPHGAFPALPPVAERLPAMQPTGGPGSRR